MPAARPATPPSARRTPQAATPATADTAALRTRNDQEREPDVDDRGDRVPHERHAHVPEPREEAAGERGERDRRERDGEDPERRPDTVVLLTPDEEDQLRAERDGDGGQRQ